MKSKVVEVNYNEVNKKPAVGDIVSTTTSAFDYNGVTHGFEETNTTITVVGVLVDSDYSEYDENKSRNGGCYGYDFYKIVEVL
ncbi:hypothetical protein [uncultured Methanobrevibacter sp.]|uniref:hypothetical protein n=1 Tax=uncultured Methanobrevibacter sp. TaxID=253161 RepID=UPI00262CBF2F|nr:hypothetical protein [uncultured Methanobrevibacter sp.]